MPRLYLLGGENILRRDASEVNQAAFEAAGQAPNVLVFPWARASFDYTYSQRKTVYDYFLSLGAGKVTFTDYPDTTQNIKEKLSQSSLVYLTGGVPSVLIERLKKIGVDKLLPDFPGVIIGRSAGALALCRRCVITYRRNCSVKVIEGLGLADLTLKAHYLPRSDNELISLSSQERIYAVPKDSAIIYDNGNMSFIGAVYSFQDGLKCRLN